RCLIEALAPTGVSHIPSAWYRFFYRLKEETCKIDFLGAMRVLVISWFVRENNGSHRSWNMLPFRGRLMSLRGLIALRCLIEALVPTGVSHIPSAWYRFFYILKEETCKIDF